MWRRFISICAGLVSTTSLFFVVAAIGDLVGGGDGKTETGVLLGLLAFFGVVMVGSGWGAVRLWRSGGFRAEAFERQVLQLAASHGGRVTVPEAAIGLALSVEQARACLDHVCAQGIAELLVSEDGDIVYNVRGLLTPSMKASARDVIST